MTKRPKPLTREKQAKLEIGHTEFSLGVKWTLFVVGLFTLFAVPAVQTYREMRQHAEGRRENPWPQCCDIFDAIPRAAAAYREHDGSWISKTFRGNAVLLQAIDKYEKDLKAESFLTQFVLPPTQEILVFTGSRQREGLCRPPAVVVLSAGHRLLHRSGILGPTANCPPGRERH